MKVSNTTVSISTGPVAAFRVGGSARINGCTALIDAGQGTTILAVAYNNRGNAYTAKEDYDRAIQDFDQSIKLNQTYTKPFNNRGVLT